MNPLRKQRILSAGKSPSLDCMKRTYNRAILNGGVTQDFSANIENIREISRKLGYNILKTPVQRNLLQFSEQFDNPIWNKPNCVITINSTIAPNGTLTADKLSANTTSSFHNVNYAPIIPKNSFYTFSVHLKKGEVTTGIISFTDNATEACHSTINLLDGTYILSGGGTIWTNLSANVTALPNDWYLCTLTAFRTNAGNTTIAPVITTNSLAAFVGNNVDGIYIWGAQLEASSFATKYQPTETTPIDGDFTNANFLYVPSSYGENKNFAQVQNKRNLLQWSDDFTNTVWTKQNTNISVNSTLNPFGINKSYYLQEAATSTGHGIYYTSFSFTIGVTYTVSFYVKKAQDSWIQLLQNGTQFPNTWINFNFDTGLFGNVGGSGSWEATQLINGYWKIRLTGISATTSSNPSSGVYGTNNSNAVTISPSYTGILNHQICDVAAIQLETGAYATLYQKTVAAGDGIVDFNFTRATSSTVTNKQGVIEDSCYNLLQRSEEFDNAYWNKSNTTISANATIAPNGTLTADSLLETATNTVHILDVTTPLIAQIGTAYTFSTYLKSNGRQWVIVESFNNSIDYYAYFDIVNGVIGTVSTGGVTARIEDAKNGWWRCSITRTVTGSTLNASILPRLGDNVGGSYLGDLTKGVYVWGNQVEKGSTPRPYLRTTNRLNFPKLDYSRSLLEPSLLIERAATNLHLQSEDFSNALWGKSASSVSLVSVLNNFDTTKSYNFSENATTAAHFLAQGISTTSGSTYTVTYFVKKSASDWVQFAFSAGFVPNSWVNFNLNTGVFGNFGASATLKYTATPVANGFWKVVLAEVCTNTGSNNTAIIYGTNNTDTATRGLSYLGTNSVICTLSATQCEVGSNATTYIPTTTATVTRNFDGNYIDLWNNSILNKDNFTLFIEGYLYDNNTNQWSIVFSNSTQGNNIDSLGIFDGIRGLYWISSASTTVGTNIPINTTFKTLIQVNGTTVKFFRNGVQLGTAQTIRTFDYRYLSVQAGTNGSTYAVNKIALFNRTLTDAEAISLTTL